MFGREGRASPSFFFHRAPLPLSLSAPRQRHEPWDSTEWCGIKSAHTYVLWSCLLRWMPYTLTFQVLRSTLTVMIGDLSGAKVCTVVWLTQHEVLEKPCPCPMKTVTITPQRRFIVNLWIKGDQHILLWRPGLVLIKI